MKKQIPFLVALALIISVVMTTVMMYGCNKKVPFSTDDKVREMNNLITL